MPATFRRGRLAVLAAALATSLVSCSQSSPPSTSASPAAIPTTEQAFGEACDPLRLEAVAEPQRPAPPGTPAGGIGLWIGFRSIAQAPCQMRGYPGLTLSARGQPLPDVTIQHSAAIPERIVAVAPGSKALTYISQQPRGCAPAAVTRFTLTPPDAARSITLDFDWSGSGFCPSVPLSETALTQGGT